MSGELRRQVEWELREMRELIRQAGAVAWPADGPDPPLRDAMATAGLLHSFYMGVENVLKRVTVLTGGRLPASTQWHRDLLAAATEPAEGRPAVLSTDLAMRLDDYLAFRHVFRNQYMHRLQWVRMAHLVDALPDVMIEFEGAVMTFLEQYEGGTAGSSPPLG